jgi:restriction system protein
MGVPKYDEMFNPLLQALRELGGSASIPEQEDAVAKILRLSDRDLAEIHRGNRTKFSYRLAWARNYLKNFGLLENSSRGVWALTALGQKTLSVDKREVKRAVSKQARKIAPDASSEMSESPEVNEAAWEDELLEVIRTMSPQAFERLCQRLLRESGFIQVEVTGRSGDGGIDGKGVVRLGGLLSFHMIFQCKRFKGSVGAPIVRDFRGAMVGRADKGLLMTTGSFTAEARRDAQREGAPPIDLIDSGTLILKLKELGLGIIVKARIVEEIIVDHGFFKGI